MQVSMSAVPPCLTWGSPGTASPGPPPRRHPHIHTQQGGLCLPGPALIVAGASASHPFSLGSGPRSYNDRSGGMPSEVPSLGMRMCAVRRGEGLPQLTSKRGILWLNQRPLGSWGAAFGSQE